MQAQQIPFRNIMMVRLFNMINVNEHYHSPFKLKVWMEKGTNWNNAGRFSTAGGGFSGSACKAATEPVFV